MNFAALIQDLVRDEGERLFPYDDATGKQIKPGDTIKGSITISVGVNISAGISQSESRTLLENRIGVVCAELDKNLPEWRQWSDARQRAIANMCFNMGWPRLSGFKDMLANMRAGHWELAALDAMDSIWSKQVGERARRISDMLRNG